jgi:hypothetical protein
MAGNPGPMVAPVSRNQPPSTSFIFLSFLLPCLARFTLPLLWSRKFRRASQMALVARADVCN